MNLCECINNVVNWVGTFVLLSVICEYTFEHVDDMCDIIENVREYSNNVGIIVGTCVA